MHPQLERYRSDFIALKDEAMALVGDPDADTLRVRPDPETWSTLQNQFSECVAAAEGLDLRRLRLPSPAIPLLYISLGAWFEAILAHERRHLDQAERILDTVTAS